MDKAKDNSKSNLKSLIQYLALTGGREKVLLTLFSCAVSYNTFVVSLPPNMQSSTNLS